MTYPPDLERLHRWTPDEYLAFERSSTTRHELIDGYIYDMVGGTKRHNRITLDTVGALQRQLSAAGTGCETFGMDMRLHFKPKDYVYPDVIVTCGTSLDDTDEVTDPLLIAEVLSPSTAQHDRTVKSNRYRQITSLRYYLLIAQDKPFVQVWKRFDTFQWMLEEALGLDAVIDLPAIGCTLALRDLYARVNFETTED